MEIKIGKAAWGKQEGDLLVAIVPGSANWVSVKEPEIEEKMKEFQKGVKDKKIKKEMCFNLSDSIPFKYLLLLSTSFIKYYSEREKTKIIGKTLLSTMESYYLNTATVLLNTKTSTRFAPELAEGLYLSHYKFDKYMKKDEDSPEPISPVITLLVESSGFLKAKKEIERRKIITSSMNLARDFVNEPGDIVYPEIFAQKAREISKENNLECTVLDEKALKKEGYPGLIQVGKGSKYPPRMVIMKYTPKRKSKVNLALVGKGLTFDTGGISLKPSNGMWDMKGDMAGGAAVLAAMESIGKLKPEVAVTGIICTAENMIGNEAQRPGDIFIAKNGKSIHVDNTDAEGRLVLTDGFFRAGEEGATHMLDIATLTGACIQAVGTALSGMMGTSASLKKAITKIGNEVGDPVWELPLLDEYKEEIKFPIADVNNVGKTRYAGASTAALFLQEFLPSKDIPWVHLDIAPTFTYDKNYKYYKPGGTGVGVRWFVNLAMRFKELIK